MAPSRPPRASWVCFLLFSSGLCSPVAQMGVDYPAGLSTIGGVWRALASPGGQGSLTGLSLQDRSVPQSSQPITSKQQAGSLSENNSSPGVGARRGAVGQSDKDFTEGNELDEPYELIPWDTFFLQDSDAPSSPSSQPQEQSWTQTWDVSSPSSFPAANVLKAYESSLGSVDQVDDTSGGRTSVTHGHSALPGHPGPAAPSELHDPDANGDLWSFDYMSGLYLVNQPGQGYPGHYTPAREDLHTDSGVAALEAQPGVGIVHPGFARSISGANQRLQSNEDEGILFQPSHGKSLLFQPVHSTQEAVQEPQRVSELFPPQPHIYVVQYVSGYKRGSIASSKSSYTEDIPQCPFSSKAEHASQPSSGSKGAKNTQI